MENRKQNKAKSLAVDMSFLMTTSLLMIFCFVFNSSMAKADSNEISEVYIEATGNNRFEAKIKAHEQGMQRALFLLANKLHIPTEDLNKIPYDKLKSAFAPKVILNEVSLLEKYNATITYSYDKGKLYTLLLEYMAAQKLMIYFMNP